MTLEDIINFANDNQIQLTIDIDPNPLTLTFIARKENKRVWQGFNLDVLNKPWDDYIGYELANMIKRLEEAECHYTS